MQSFLYSIFLLLSIVLLFPPSQLWQLLFQLGLFRGDDFRLEHNTGVNSKPVAEQRMVISEYNYLCVNFWMQFDWFVTDVGS